MFANCDALKEKAREIVRLTDRILYWPFLDYIEKFATNNNCYLAGDVAVNRLIGRCAEGEFCDATYELYCDNVFPTGQRLADELHRMDSPFLSSKTVVLQTVLKHRELVVSINARPLVRMFGMERIRGRRLPFVLPSGQYLPIEQLIVGVYRRLYTPCEAAKWPDMIDIESQLFHRWRTDKPQHDIGEESSMANLHRAIVSRFRENSTLGILVGDFGLNQLVPCETRRLQFVSSMDNDDLAATLKKILAKASMAHNVTRVTFSQNSLVLFNDPQLTLTTFYVETASHGGPRFALCDVWNSTCYEMIPTMAGHSKSSGGEHFSPTAHPFVILKLFFADAWVAMINGRKVPDRLTDNILLTRQYLIDCPESVIPQNYLGNIITDRAAKKKIIGEEPRLPDYLPGSRS